MILCYNFVVAVRARIVVLMSYKHAFIEEEWNGSEHGRKRAADDFR